MNSFVRNSFNSCSLLYKFCNLASKNINNVVGVSKSSNIVFNNRYCKEKNTEMKEHFRNINLPYKSYILEKEEIEENIKNRNLNLDENIVEDVINMYDVKVDLIQRLQKLRHERKNNADEVKNLFRQKDKDKELIKKTTEDGKKLKEEIGRLEIQKRKTEIELQELALLIPNSTHPFVPIGDESNVKIVSHYIPSNIPSSFFLEGCNIPVEQLSEEQLSLINNNKKSRKWVDHLTFGTNNDNIDFSLSGKVTGRKFVFLKRVSALLDLALQNWAVHKLISPPYNFIPISTPDIILSDISNGCGFQPRDSASSHTYEVIDPHSHEENRKLYLAATAEIPLMGMFYDKIIPAADLPIKLVGFGSCFRAEVGEGKQSRGLYRIHQFSKVEMISVCSPQTSELLHDELLQIQQDLYKELEIPFRVLDMPTAELGNPAYRKYDIEAWFPSINGYGEICSASNCTDYQSIRLNIRANVKPKDNRFVHTLNATACAIPRTIMAIMENFQNEDGSVTIPKALTPYLKGIDTIHP